MASSLLFVWAGNCTGRSLALPVLGPSWVHWSVLVIAFIAVPPVDNCPWDAKYALERFWRSIACADEVRSGLVLNSRTSVSELVTSVVLHGLLLFGGF